MFVWWPCGAKHKQHWTFLLPFVFSCFLMLYCMEGRRTSVLKTVNNEWTYLINTTKQKTQPFAQVVFCVSFSSSFSENNVCPEDISGWNYQTEPTLFYSIMTIKNVFPKSKQCNAAAKTTTTVFSPTKQSNVSTLCVEPKTWQTLWHKHLIPAGNMDTSMCLPPFSNYGARMRLRDRTWCIMYGSHTDQLCQSTATLGQSRCWLISAERGVHQHLPEMRFTFRLHMNLWTVSTPGLYSSLRQKKMITVWLRFLL